MKVPLKSVLYLVGFLCAIGLYTEYNHSQKVKELEQKRQDLLDQVEKDKRAALAAQKKEADSIYSLMEAEIYSLQDQTQRLTRKVRYYETRPEIDLDFVTAADIILGAEYRPRPGNGNPR